MVRLMRWLFLVVLALSLFAARAQRPERGVALSAHVTTGQVRNFLSYEMNFALFNKKHCLQFGPYFANSEIQKIYPGLHAAYLFHPFDWHKRFRSYFSLDYYFYHGNHFNGVSKPEQLERRSHMFNGCYGVEWDIKSPLYLTANLGFGWGSEKTVGPDPAYNEWGLNFNYVMRAGLGYYFNAH
jgi:hypothetical protein